MRRAWYVVPALLVSLVFAGTPAYAAPNPEPNHVWKSGTAVIYEAGVSQSNRLVVTYVDATTLKLADTSRVIPGQGCVQGASTVEALCAVDSNINYHLDIYLGSNSDTLDFVGNLWRPLTMVDAGNGNDDIDFGSLTSKGGHAYGGLGDDTLTAPSTSNTQLWLDGQEGADTMCGGSRTYAMYDTRTSPVTVSANGVANDGPAGEGDNVCSTVGGVFGSPYGDNLYAGSGNTFLYGLGGDDKLYGSWGNDRLEGGANNDTIYGYSGDDTILGGTGTDWLDGGLGYLDYCLGDAADTEVNCET